jgi:hypothetical protein
MKIIDFLNKHSDKLLHFSICFFIATMGARINPLLGLLLALLFAIVKEAYDIRKRGFNKDNAFDMIADILGITLALL